MQIEQKQLRKDQIGQVVAMGSVGIILGVGGLMLCPQISLVAQAENGNDEAVMLANVDVASSVSIAVQDSVDIDAAPKAGSNGFTSQKARLTVATNSDAGYSIYMHTSDGSSQLKSVNLDNAKTIDPVPMNTAVMAFPANTWGYSFDGTYYNPVPKNTITAVFQTDTTAFRDDYDISFGVAVDESLPVGRYTNNVVISAVANPSVATSLEEISYMQAMTPEICENTAEEYTKQLIDTRDGNKYWVAKLKDGNCWMTQNLALNITEKGLSHLDTDIKNDWNSNTLLYPPQTTLTVANGVAPSIYSTYSWNLNDVTTGGKYVSAIPAVVQTCNNVTSDLSACRAQGFVDVSGEKFQPGYHVSTGNWEGTTPVENTLLTVNCTEWEGTGTAKTCVAGEYDEHYLVGNYYQWNTAIAGEGAVVTGVNQIAPQSICPKGWKLPLGGAGYNNTDGSFYNLLDKYGLALYTTNKDTGYNLFDKPLYYIRSGHVMGSYLDYVSTYGSYYSAVRTNGNDVAFYWNISGSSSDSAGTNPQYGRSVRCVAR